MVLQLGICSEQRAVILFQLPAIWTIALRSWRGIGEAERFRRFRFLGSGLVSVEPSMTTSGDSSGLLSITPPAYFHVEETHGRRLVTP